MIAVLIVAFAGFLIYLYRDSFIRTLFGSVRHELSDIVATGFATLECVLSGSGLQARSNSEQLARQLVAFYGRTLAQRWIIGTVLGLLGGVAAFSGTIFIHRQNQLLEGQMVLMASQNQKIDIQSHLLESQRVAVLSPQLNALLQEIRLAKGIFAVETAGVLGRQLFDLPDGLVDHVVAVSRSLRPIRMLDHEPIQLAQ